MKYGISNTEAQRDDGWYAGRRRYTDLPFIHDKFHTLHNRLYNSDLMYRCYCTRSQAEYPLLKLRTFPYLETRPVLTPLSRRKKFILIPTRLPPSATHSVSKPDKPSTVVATSHLRSLVFPNYYLRAPTKYHVQINTRSTHQAKN